MATLVYFVLDSGKIRTQNATKRMAELRYASIPAPATGAIVALRAHDSPVFSRAPASSRAHG
jgi:hypothetical protein